MRAYFAYDIGGIEELGEVTRKEVPELIEKADASLVGVSHFGGLGLYRTEQDFMEIRPVGKSQYLICSDVISASSNRGFWTLSPRRLHIRKIVFGFDAAVAAAHDYMDCTRAEFEQRYR